KTTNTVPTQMPPVTIPEITLHSGNRKTMPALVLGTGSYPIPAPETVVQAVLDAIELGYRNFDAAAAYFTEEYLGEAISQ
ncbi:aldo/keto reductase, partial [Mycobacterium kansasii]